MHHLALWHLERTSDVSGHLHTYHKTCGAEMQVAGGAVLMQGYYNMYGHCPAVRCLNRAADTVREAGLCTCASQHQGCPAVCVCENHILATPNGDGLQAGDVTASSFAAKTLLSTHILDCALLLSANVVDLPSDALQADGHAARQPRPSETNLQHLTPGPTAMYQHIQARP